MSDYLASTGGRLRALGITGVYLGYAAHYVPLIRRGWTDLGVQNDRNHAQILEAILSRSGGTNDFVALYEPLPADTTLSEDRIRGSLGRFFAEALAADEMELRPGTPRLGEPEMCAIEEVLSSRRPDLLDAARALRTECLDRVWLSYAPPNVGGGIEVDTAVEIGQALWKELASVAVDELTGALSERGRLLAQAARGLPLGFRVPT